MLASISGKLIFGYYTMPIVFTGLIALTAVGVGIGHYMGWLPVQQSEADAIAYQQKLQFDIDQSDRQRYARLQSGDYEYREGRFGYGIYRTNDD